MSPPAYIRVFPYDSVVGQQNLKLALELTYVDPRIGGVLISGQRGTGKSTAVRAFAQMMYGSLPVTLPINATEDRVVGGWKIDALLRGEPEPQPGLIAEADGQILYIDEVNLLDDHIVNILLDVAATGLLVVEREGRDETQEISFVLVGTMNPEEGFLRPQLLDRFGLMVQVAVAREERVRILESVLRFETSISDRNDEENAHAVLADVRRRKELELARQHLHHISISDTALHMCVALAEEFEAEGHRAEVAMILAARALASIQRETIVTPQHILKVAPLALRHRRPEAQQNGRDSWTEEDTAKVERIVYHAQ